MNYPKLIITGSRFRLVQTGSNGYCLEKRVTNAMGDPTWAYFDAWSEEDDQRAAELVTLICGAMRV